ncbi:MAG: hypothetical protein UH963_07630 [Agathobacter sp.]|nr:hypothetical protein [Agathobacter sp.]
MFIAILLFELHKYGYICNSDDDSDEPDSRYEYLSGVDLKVYTYGDDFNLGELEYEKLDNLKITKSMLNHDYVYLFINDETGKYDISKKAAKKLIEVADDNINFSFFYIGKNKLEMFAELIPDVNLNDDDKSIGYTVYEGSRLVYFGLWTEYDEGFPDEDGLAKLDSILDTLIENIKSNEEGGTVQ